MMPQKPDVLLIVLDTLRRDRLSIYGHHQQTSPEFDAFAAQATLFDRAIAPAQWTIPSHASMFTGLYPSTHQLTQANSGLSGSYPSLAEILQADGYSTAAFCNNPLLGVLNTGLQRGFTEFYNYAGAAPNRPLDVHRSRARKALARRWRQFARAVSNQFAYSDQLFRVSLHPRFTPVWTRWVNYKGHTQKSIDDTIEYLHAHRAGGKDRDPLFLFLNLMGTHLPYRPPQADLHRFAPEVSRDRHAYQIMNRFNADAARWASPADPPLSEWETHVINSFYAAEVAHQDYHLGRLLRYLRQSGTLDATLVIITADHGEGHGDHDFFGHSFVVYQELVHVPLVIHDPARFPTGRRVTTNISTRRIFHTVLNAAGITPPLDEADPNADVSGLSLARSVNCQPDTENGLVFTEAFPPHTLVSTIQHRRPALIERLQLTQVRRGMYDGTHKLALVADAVEGLFDVETDPVENQDISGQNTSLVMALKEKMDTFVKMAEYHRAGGMAYTHVSGEVMENLRALGYIE